MQYFQDVLTITMPTTDLFEAFDLVSPAGARVAGADAPVLGVAKHPNTVIGDFSAVMVLGTARVRAVGAIAVGNKLVSAAAGGVQAAGADPANAFAIALNDAADGGFVDILIR